jgi:protein-L-isoaspartate(D-aspartate) O-methyltransferase
MTAMLRRKVIGLCFTIPFVLFGSVLMKNEKPDPYEKNRAQMVREQIQRRGVEDPLVIKAMLKVPRHFFVPEKFQPYAYEDEPLPIDFGQTISQPYIVAYMTEALGLKRNEKVLEIGTGSGYQAAVLAEIVKTVYTIEIVKPLADRAKDILHRLGYTNIFCLCADGYEGWPSAAPFDAIIVTAAPSEIPEPLVRQLKDGGRMILPIGDVWQELILILKRKDHLEKKSLIPVRFVPMTGQIQHQR